MYLKKDKLLVILGSTSTGKTDLALGLAKRFNGEIVACDSRQVYKGLDIGTGKLPGKKVLVKRDKGFWEMDGVKVWMYDVANFMKQYTVYDYVKDAKKIIDEIIKRKKLPIIVGGTGFYLKALLEDLPNLLIPSDLELRKELENLSVIKLQEKVQKYCLKKWENMNYSDRQNPRRLIRALELKNIKSNDNKGLNQNFEILKIGLNAPREILFKRIDERVIGRVNQGMVEEAKKLHKNGMSLKRMRQLGLEYGVLAEYLGGEIKDIEEFMKILQGKIHGYARRQLTWYKKEKNVYWIDITQSGLVSQVESKVNSWYYSTCDKKN